MKASRRQRRSGKDVFINCPFDESYQPVFRAIVFAIRACRLNPRCALEIDDASEVRVEKIIRIMRGCSLSVHDISRTDLDHTSKLPRFNMPFELGLFLGLDRGARKTRPSLILDAERYRYQQFLSDIAGQDIRAHAGDPLRVITHIRDWLNTIYPAERFMGGRAFGKLYTQFTEDLPKLLESSRLDASEITFVDWNWLISDWLNVNQHLRGK